MREIKTLQEQDFTQDTLNRVDRMVVLFESPWCQGCNAIVKIIQGLSDDEAKGCIFGKVDVSVQPALAQRFGVLSLPTVLVFHNGELIDRMVGKISREKLMAGAG